MTFLCSLITIILQSYIHKNTGKGKVGIMSVKGVISSICKLHEVQVAHGLNSFPHPRGKTVKQFINYLKTQEHKRKRENKVDPG